MPDSSTGGYLLPTSTNGDLNDVALAVFLQALVVGVTGLPGPLVRPRWQPEPPAEPDFGTNWASVGPSGEIDRDHFSASIHQSADGVSSTTEVSNRVIPVLCSFYGPLAATNFELLANGLKVPQNREMIQLAGFNLVAGVTGPTPVPIQQKNRWTYRVDGSFRIRQQQAYTYQVFDLVAATATLNAAEGSTVITETINVSDPE
jgi:hypothetical protein